MDLPYPLRTLPYFIMSLFLIIGCDRTVDFVPPAANTNLPSEVFLNNEVEPVEFNVTAELGDTLLLDDETSNTPTQLILPQNLCVYGNGDPCKGELEVQLIQAFTKSEMIFSGVPTTSNGIPLESGGAFYVNITQGGEQVFIRQDARFILKVPVDRTTGDPEQMQFYRFLEVAPGINDWQLESDLEARDEEYYTVSFNELDQWLNVDYQIPVDVEELLINLQYEGEPVSDAEVYYSLNGYNSVGKAELQEGSFTFKGLVPKGTEVQIIAIRKVEESWFWNEIEADLQRNLNLNLEPVSYQDIVSVLQKL